MTATPRIARPVALFTVLILGLILGLPLGACRGVPGPAASNVAVLTLDRVEHAVDVGDGDERVVSALLSAGEPSGQTLVLYIHGTPGHATGWADYLIDPVPGARAVAVDRPGFGESDARALTTLEGQARALAPFIESAERVILVGHSYGGPVALQAALDWPDRVQGVVVIAGSVSPSHERLRWFNYVGLGISPFLSRDLRRANDEVWSLKADLQRLALELGSIRAPVAIVHGTRDSLVPHGNVAFMEGALTGVARLEVRTLEGADHFVIWEEKWVPEVRAAIAGMVAPRAAVTLASETTTRSSGARARPGARTR